MKQIIIILLGLSWCLSAMAWNQAGHLIIAQIAYDKLQLKVRLRVDQLTQEMSKSYPGEKNFVSAAFWPDYIKGDGVTAFNSWHYINLPYSPDHHRSFRPYPQNVVWAINQSEQVLSSPTANDYEKALFLRFLVHFVGDVHQPMHTITRFTKAWPYGDKGGNQFPIKDSHAKSLHQLWDQGVGSFGNGALMAKQVRKMSTDIEQAYPPSTFKGRLSDDKPQDWAQESHELAIKYAYNTNPYQSISKAYRAEGQIISQKQLALAGYRLANVLNEAYPF